MLYMNMNMQYWKERFKYVLNQMHPEDKFVP